MYARLSALLLACLLAVAGLANAQETTGKPWGQVNDPQGLAVPGATVTVTGPQGQRDRHRCGRPVGRSVPRPGIYTVRVELQGFKAAEQQNIIVALASRREVNLRLETGGLTETVQVDRGRARHRRAQHDGRRRARLRAALVGCPSGARSPRRCTWCRASATARARARHAVDRRRQRSREQLHHRRRQHHRRRLRWHGLLQLAYGSLGAGVTSDFIKETQVMTAGFEAEYGQASGGVVNVVTKSGTNVFSGSVVRLHASRRPPKPGGAQLTTPNGTVNTESTRHARRRHLARRPDRPRQGCSSSAPTIRSGRTAHSLRRTTRRRCSRMPALGGVDRKRTIQAYAGKLTAQMQSNHRLDFSFFGDPATGDGLQRFSRGPPPRLPGRAGNERHQGRVQRARLRRHNQAVRYDGVFGSRWLLEAQPRERRRRSSTRRRPSTTTCSRISARSPARVRLPAGRVCPQGVPAASASSSRTTGQNLQYRLKSTHILNGGGNARDPLRRAGREHRLHARHELQRRRHDARQRPHDGHRRSDPDPHRRRHHLLPRHARPPADSRARRRRTTPASSCRTRGRPAA